jgi:hypothetical protein
MRALIWFLGLALAVILQLAGCGGSSDDASSSPEIPSLVAPATWEASFTQPAQDAGGWSILTPAADSRLIYVASGGNDGTAQPYLPSDPEIGSDPFNPGGAIRPYASIDAALTQMRNGYPDYLLLHRGDSWDATASIFPRAGRSAGERSVLGYYGANVARPVVRFAGVDLSRASYSAVVGIRFVAAQRDPASPDFIDFNVNATGLHALGGYNNTVVGGLLIEDCWFDWFSGNVLQAPESGGGPVLADVIVRRNIFSNNYSSTSHSQGLYSDRASILLEENIFDHNGWYQQALNNDRTDGGATFFNHNTYFGGTRDTIFRGNLFLRAASIGSKFTSNTASGTNQIKTWNLQIDNNLYVEGEIGISLGGNDDQNNGPRWSNIQVTNNVMMHIGRAQPTRRTLGWGLDVQDWRGGLVQKNIFASWGDSVVSNTYALHSVGHTSDLEYSDNIVYKVAGNNPLITFTDDSVQTRVQFFGNEIQGTRLLLNDLSEKDVFHDNYYSSTLDQSRWFAATGTTYLSLDDYRARSGDTSSVAAARSYVDPDRSVESYLAGLGFAPDMDSFAAELKQQSRFNWRPELTAGAINSYIRAGFCLSGNAGCR